MECLQMFMECKVCLSPNVGLHYQTVCCRACAAFYRRTVYKKLNYKCSRKENCDVTYDSRYSCRYCRLKKCIAVGMILSDEPSTSTGANTDSTGEEIDSEGAVEDDEWYRIENVQSEPAMFIDRMQEKLRLILSKEYHRRSPYTVSLCEQFSAARAQHARKWPRCTKEKMYHRPEIDIDRAICDFYKGMVTAAEFCMDIQNFAELPPEEKPSVFKHFEERFTQINRAFTTTEFLGKDLDDTRFVAIGGQVVDLNNCSMKMDKVSNLSEERWKSILIDSEKKVDIIFIRPFKRFHADEFEIDFLLGLCMWSLDDMKGLSKETNKKSEKIRERLAEELTLYYKYEKDTQQYSTRIYKLFNLMAALDRVIEMRQEEGLMAKTFEMLNIVHLDEITGEGR